MFVLVGWFVCLVYVFDLAGVFRLNCLSGSFVRLGCWFVRLVGWLAGLDCLCVWFGWLVRLVGLVGWLGGWSTGLIGWVVCLVLVCWFDKFGCLVCLCLCVVGLVCMCGWFGPFVVWFVCLRRLVGWSVCLFGCLITCLIVVLICVIWVLFFG